MLRFVPVFIATFFLSIHAGAILYVNSSLLGSFFGSGAVSLVFIIGALGTVMIFLFAPKLIDRFGKRPLLSIFLFLAALGTFSLAFATWPWLVALSFIAYASSLPMIYYCLDIFLEELSLDGKTGEIRGSYLTVLNLGIALGPFALAFFSSIGDELRPVYLAAGFLLIVPIMLALFSFKTETPKEHEPFYHSARLPFGDWWNNVSVRRITLSRLVLESFFVFMVIYTPIYLHSNLGFDWLELGVMFTVMLLPFVLFQWPAGELADRFYGEKEMLSIGFLITGLSLLIMPFIGKIFWAWMAVLFLSRVGASLIEIMTESYFFKQIAADDTGFISIFRLTRPASVILGAAIGAVALNLVSFEKLFLVVAIIVFLGLRESLSLQDTR
ncbi:MAG: MFS transporter [Parcubacteria group bacterium]